MFSCLDINKCLSQVRSTFPMIPIGGIQMVRAVPTSVTTPLAQQGALQAASRLSLQENTSDAYGEATHFTSFTERGGGGGEKLTEPSPHASLQKEGGGMRKEQEESIHTCTRAIASLCIDSEEHAERRRGGCRGNPSPLALSHDSQQCSPSIDSSPPHPSPLPLTGPGIQHFTGLELRPPHPSIPTSPSSPHPAETLQPPPASRPLKLERDGEAESTKRSRDVS